MQNDHFCDHTLDSNLKTADCNLPPAAVHLCPGCATLLLVPQLSQASPTPPPPSGAGHPLSSATPAGQRLLGNNKYSLSTYFWPNLSSQYKLVYSNSKRFYTLLTEQTQYTSHDKLLPYFHFPSQHILRNIWKICLYTSGMTIKHIYASLWICLWVRCEMVPFWKLEWSPLLVMLCSGPAEIHPEPGKQSWRMETL